LSCTNAPECSHVQGGASVQLSRRPGAQATVSIAASSG
jgi:hypothetical protein